MTNQCKTSFLLLSISSRGSSIGLLFMKAKGSTNAIQCGRTESENWNNLIICDVKSKEKNKFHFVTK